MESHSSFEIRGSEFQISNFKFQMKNWKNAAILEFSFSFAIRNFHFGELKGPAVARILIVTNPPIF